MTFSKAFKDCYNDFLVEYGYQYCAKLELFVKVRNQELIYFIGTTPVPAACRDNEAFTIVAGIMSIYFSSCTKQYFRYNERRLQMFSPSLDYGMGFEYNDGNMMEIIQSTIPLTDELILPVFDKVINLDTYIEYQVKYGINVLQFCEKFSDDSLVLIKANNHDDFQEYLNNELHKLEDQMQAIYIGKDNVYEENYTLIYNGVKEWLVNSRDKVYENKELLMAANAEADRRKEVNLKQLEKYKIKI